MGKREKAEEMGGPGTDDTHLYFPPRIFFRIISIFSIGSKMVHRHHLQAEGFLIGPSFQPRCWLDLGVHFCTSQAKAHDKASLSSKTKEKRKR